MVFLFLGVRVSSWLPPMAASALASPLCTWQLVAACMSVTFEEDSLTRVSMFHSSKKLSPWARRKKLVSKCISRGGADFASNMLSYGFGIQNIMSSGLSLDPCNEYNNSKGLHSSMTFCGETGFSLFGYQTAWNRRQRRMNRAAKSGNCQFFFFFNSKVI